MRFKFWVWPFALVLGGCSTVPREPAPLPTSPAPAPPVEVQILAINDFHGNLEPPKLSVPAKDSAGNDVPVPAGGVAYLAGALNVLRQGHPNSITVSAGDLIGATPLTSALFLDKPTIHAMNQLGLELNAVGNHEFDKGSQELLRMQRGGCEQHTRRKPCAVEPFDGARFQFLAANVVSGNGATLFPATAIRQLGPVKIGFIGMTLKETGTLVTPSGVAGLTFLDEAATANALVPRLKAEGADTVVLLIHQGGRSSGHWSDPACPGLSGDILPILEKLDPSIQLVVSGHTHAAYRCELPLPDGQGTRLLTSSGRYGTFVTDIRLTFDPSTRALLSKAANLNVVQGEAFGSVQLSALLPIYPADERVSALVERYTDAARPQAERVVGRIDGPISADPDENRERLLGDWIADSQLGWTRPAGRGGAQIAFMNGFGVRKGLEPRADGSVTYAQIFAMQPFGNGLVVQTLTGAQIKRLLEQQFASGTNTAENLNMLLPSEGFFFAYDLSRPAGDRVVAITLDGKPIDPNASYRVTTNSFLASGGDNFTVLTEGTERIDAGSDLDATEAWLQSGGKSSLGGRIEDRTPEPTA